MPFNERGTQPDTAHVTVEGGVDNDCTKKSQRYHNGG